MRKTLLLAALATMLFSGCGVSFARTVGADRDSPAIVVVRRGAYSGEIVLIGRATSAHYAAEDAMLAHCRGRVRFASGSEAERLAVIDPSDTSKLGDDVFLSSDVERVSYVCVTLEQTLSH